MESTFKHRPDESQGGLNKEKIQKLCVFNCQNVDHDAIKAYLRENKDCYVVYFAWVMWLYFVESMCCGNSC